MVSGAPGSDHRGVDGPPTHDLAKGLNCASGDPEASPARAEKVDLLFSASGGLPSEARGGQFVDESSAGAGSENSRWVLSFR